MDKHKRCPHCGGEPVPFYWDVKQGHRVCIKCEACGAQTQNHINYIDPTRNEDAFYGDVSFRLAWHEWDRRV